jgi:hypothetical protein
MLVSLPVLVAIDQSSAFRPRSLIAFDKRAMTVLRQSNRLPKMLSGRPYEASSVDSRSAAAG